MGKRWFGYVDDFGELYAIELDEQNTELVNTTADADPGNVPTAFLPTGVVPRTLRYNSVDGLYTRTVVLLGNTPESLAAAPGLVTFPTKAGDIAMQLTSYIGERQRFVTQTDTRQTDGDTESFTPAPP